MMVAAGVDSLQSHGNIWETNENEIKEKEAYKPKTSILLVFAFIVLHMLSLIGAYLSITSWTGVMVFFFNYFTFGVYVNLGVTMGAHRLWSHRSYKATLPVKIILLIGFTLAGQNSLLIWVRDHRTHHKFSDTDGDPHNSKRGFFFSHMGWLLCTKHPDVKRKGKTVDLSDLTSDPIVMFQYKYFFPLFFFFNALVVYVGVLVGFPFWHSFFIGFVLRYVLGLHFTWSVNSLAHFYGTKPYTREIVPVESKIVSALTRGEGWHNYHHTFPWDYKASEFGNKLNFSCQMIELLAKFGLVYDLKTTSTEMVKNWASKYGDGTHKEHADY
ncbi:acyl-CoA Delta(11) desaturase-like [Cimex lectularius]|uniref:Fatty acid desaturase domain-containing protein n=1 Tax=Cimex lectularius TaxID=79782 RepID=A0A8I6SD18_CIMLE|nr:acyl-CoA Delta(11) desaturase-like [Cimex lectularius]